VALNDIQFAVQQGFAASQGVPLFLALRQVLIEAEGRECNILNGLANTGAGKLSIMSIM
jgi:hypothetical protein